MSTTDRLCNTTEVQQSTVCTFLLSFNISLSLTLPLHYYRTVWPSIELLADRRADDHVPYTFSYSRKDTSCRLNPRSRSDHDQLFFAVQSGLAIASERFHVDIHVLERRPLDAVLRSFSFLFDFVPRGYLVAREVEHTDLKLGRVEVRVEYHPMRSVAQKGYMIPARVRKSATESPAAKVSRVESDSE